MIAVKATYVYLQMLGFIVKKNGQTKNKNLSKVQITKKLIVRVEYIGTFSLLTLAKVVATGRTGQQCCNKHVYFLWRPLEGPAGTICFSSHKV